MDETPNPGFAPLAGLRVVELAQNLAGPYCAQILADLGAEVIKIEPPGRGDAARAWGPPFCGDDGAIFGCANRNKRSIALDLKTPRGREVTRELIARADVVVEAFRPGALARMGFGYDDVKTYNPRVIYCSILAYGAEGPLADLPGYDPLMQAHGGVMAVTGPAGGPTTRVGTSIIDMGTGMWLAIAILAAIRERDRTGEGRHLSAALFDTALAWSAYHLMGYLASGEVPGPMGTELPMIAPYGAFPTADGRVMIAAGNDGLFARACEALDIPDLAHDPAYADNPSRVRNRETLNDAFSVATRRHASDEVIRRLRDTGVPCAPILGIDEVATDPQTLASGMLGSVPHPGLPGYPMVALPIRWDGERAPVRTPPPRVGEHTAEILEELGFPVE